MWNCVRKKSRKSEPNKQKIQINSAPKRQNSTSPIQSGVSFPLKSEDSKAKKLVRFADRYYPAKESKSDKKHNTQEKSNMEITFVYE